MPSENSTMGSQVPVEDEERIIFNSEDDLAYEEDILRNGFSVKHWLRYAEHKKAALAAKPGISIEVDNEIVNMIYERALKQLPGSYKLWHTYLKLRVSQVKQNKDKKFTIIHPAYEDVNNCFERSLVFMHKMPRIWLEYLEILMEQHVITRTRRTFDRALQALPITQHQRIWPLYLKFVRAYDIPETGIRVYRRYLKLQPEMGEEFVDYLRLCGRLDAAAVKLAELVNNEHFMSREGKSKHQMWTELAEMICRNPDKISSLNVDAIMREGIKRYTDQQGKLWCSLAEYYTRSGLFERARDIYEEAIKSVMTIRDFSQVFEAYAQSEERIISSMMESENVDDDELDLRMIRYEDLIERRPLLLNSVALRQNPHNVEEWHKRVQLLEDKPEQVVYTFTEAVQTVDPKQAIGKVSSLWIEFARYYEKNDQLEDARLILDKATQAQFSKVEDLAQVWCEYAEMEVRNGNPKAAIKVMERATAAPPRKKGAKKTSINYFDEKAPVQYRVYKSLKLWSLYADLEESFGTFLSCKSVYERIIELRIATPQIIMNYGLFLEENNYFEEAFRAYEKGIALFRWPNCYDIWNTYLTKFLKRYKGTKLERARDLFEQCLESCPPKFAKNFYLLYAKLEEDFGLSKRAMSIYDRATRAVLPQQRMEVYQIYIKKAAELYGVTYTRQIYEKAIEELDDEGSREMCLRFADVERKLGEVDRARAIYAHCSQFCDPRVTQKFWDTWKEFEVRHGNEDTIREMLRIKRSVQATFNTQVNFMTASMLAAAASAGSVAANDAMRLLETENQRTEPAETNQENEPSTANAPTISRPPLLLTTGDPKKISFVKGDTVQAGQPSEAEAKVQNPDEIDINDEDEEEEEEDEDEAGDDAQKERTKSKGDHLVVKQKMVPREVFGGLAKQDSEGEEEENH